MDAIFLAGGQRQGPLALDPRTKLYLLVLCNIIIFVNPSLLFEAFLALSIALLGVLSAAGRFSLRTLLLYGGLLAVQLLAERYLPPAWKTTIVSFALFLRKVLPCVMLGGILVCTTRVSAFMAALQRLRVPRSVLIPLTVMLRYLPMVQEEWRAIKDAMGMRGIQPTVGGFLQHPMLTAECIYVPLLLSASRIADELSAAAVSRGIENPVPRTCLARLTFRWQDAAVAAAFTAMPLLALYL